MSSRAGAYATSTKNMVGLALAVVGLILHFVGLVGWYWPFVMVALYAAGALLAPPEMRHVELSPTTWDPDAVRRALAQLDRRIKGRLQLDVQTLVTQIRTRILGLLDRVAEQPIASEDVYVLGRMATDYLPETIEPYLRLPLTYQMTHRLTDGQTPHDLVIGQLTLLQQRLEEVTNALFQGDSDRLAAQGRFLQEKFGTSPLTLDAGPSKRSAS